MPHHDDDTKISLPRQFARTRRFTLGAPSAFTVSADGSVVLFLRSRAGDDPVTCLWALDAGSGEERLLADPAALTGGGTQGIGSYATDDAAGLAVFTLAGALWAVDVPTGAARTLPVPGTARDPRPDPAGRLVAYLSGGALRVIGADGAGDRAVAEPDGPDVRFGVAEYAASASMGRSRGYWWSPDGARLLTARVDEAGVAFWHVGDPAEPARPPRAVRYPAAGTANADVTLWIARVDGAVDGGRVEVTWDRTAFEYLTAAGWDAHGPYLSVQSRDQRTVRVLAADPDSGRTRLLAEQHDPHWVQLVPGTPARTGSGRLVAHADLDGTRRLTVGGVPVTPPGLHLEAVLGVDGEDVLFTASDDPAQTHLWLHTPAAGAHRLSVAPGVHGGTRRGGTLVHVIRTAEHPGERVRVERPAAGAASPARSG
ncbi:DPP IV N-terminal domain-containing protein, partial [Nonomuraea sp. NPDC001684]